MKKKAAVLLITPALLIGFAVGTSASTGLEKITSNLNYNLNFKIDGVVWKPTKDDGTAIAPITYEGTTYLPARAVAEALNVAVNYDAATTTVLFGERSEGVPAVQEKVDLSAGITRTKDKNKTTFGGKDYKEVYYAKDVSPYFGESLGFYPEKKYQKLYLQLASLDQDIRVIAYDRDYVQLLETEVKKGDELSTVEIDIGGLDYFYVEFKTLESDHYSNVVVPLSTYYK